MRIVCTNCSAKYAIADEKVSGKVFKVRCKKCQQIIVVRGTGQEDWESAAVAEVVNHAASVSGFGSDSGRAQTHDATVAVPSPMYAPEPEAQWHVVINGEQIGPLGPAEMQQRFRQAEINLDSFVWRDGMADWKRLNTIPELVGQTSSSNGTGAAPAHAWSSEQAVPTATASAEASFSDESLRSPASSKLTATRNENSVLFSLSDLQSVAMGQPLTSRPASNLASDSESTGLADIRSMAAGITRNDTAEDDLVETLGRLSAPSTAPVLFAPAARQVSTWVIPTLAGLAGLLLVAIGIMGYLLVAKKSESSGKTQVVLPQPTPAVVVQPKASAPDLAPVAVAVVPPPAPEPPPAVIPPPVALEPAVPQAKSETRPKPSSRPSPTPTPSPSPSPSPSSTPIPSPSPSPSKPAAKDDLDALLQGAIKGGAFEKPSTTKKPAPASDSPYGDDDEGDLPERLTTAQIRSGMSSVKDRIQACYQQHHVSGIVNVKVTIASTGRVSSATVSGSFAGTPTGQCVERVVKSAHFPPFKSASMSVDYPYVLPIR